MDSAVAELLARAGGGGVFAALGGLEETTADVMTRMDLYAMYLPRLARWEAELAVDDLARGVDPNVLVAELERLARAVDRIATVAEGAPALVERERSAALDALRDERIAATRDLREERRTVLDAVRQERIATLEELEAIATRLVNRSGDPIHGAVREEMKLLADEMERMRKRLVEDAEQTMNRVVDHAFIRAVYLLAIAAALGAVGLILHARFLRR
jgi:hypothetical protein